MKQPLKLSDLSDETLKQAEALKQDMHRPTLVNVIETLILDEAARLGLQPSGPSGSAPAPQKPPNICTHVFDALAQLTEAQMGETAHRLECAALLLRILQEKQAGDSRPPDWSRN